MLQANFELFARSCIQNLLPQKAMVCEVLSEVNVPDMVTVKKESPELSEFIRKNWAELF